MLSTSRLSVCWCVLLLCSSHSSLGPSNVTLLRHATTHNTRAFLLSHSTGVQDSLCHIKPDQRGDCKDQRR